MSNGNTLVEAAGLLREHSAPSGGERDRLKKLLTDTLCRSLATKTIEQTAEDCVVAMEESAASLAYSGRITWMTLRELDDRFDDPFLRVGILKQD